MNYYGYVAVLQIINYTAGVVAIFKRLQCVEFSSRGYDDLNNIQTAISRYEKSHSHINAFVNCKTFGRCDRIDLILDKQRSLTICNYNEEVNIKDILRRLIKMTFFLGMQEPTFSTRDNRTLL